jgi:hypothetical protein
MPMFRLLLSSLILLTLGLLANAESRKIGTAVEITNQVTATEEGAKRQLATGNPVRELEVLEAARNSRGEFILADNTKLALGPNARLALNKFVYDPDKTTGGKVTVNLAKGAFRFITGNSSKEAYEIKTPTVSLGVRGTLFDGYVADNGAMVVLLLEGAVNICTTTCLLDNRPRRLVYVTEQGAILPPRATWDSSQLPGVSVETAFPFLESRLRIDPTIHMHYADLFVGPSLLKKAEIESQPTTTVASTTPPPPPPAGTPPVVALVPLAVGTAAILTGVLSESSASP